MVDEIDPMVERSPYQKAQDTLDSLRFAYNQTFSANTNKYSDDVMDDLRVFCRADETTFHADPRIHAAFEGRREVFLRIQKFLSMDLEELSKLFIKKGR